MKFFHFRFCSWCIVESLLQIRLIVDNFWEEQLQIREANNFNDYPKAMSNGKDLFENIEFAQWSLDETSIDCEASSDSTASESSTNKAASSAEHVGEKQPEQTVSTKGNSSVYFSIMEIFTFIRKQAEKIPKVRM